MKSKFFRRMTSGMGVLLLLVITFGTVLAAWINLTPGHSCAPTQGHFLWTHSPNSQNILWYQYEKWTGSQYTCIHNVIANWYHLETEAYNPGAQTSCDKLHNFYFNTNLLTYQPTEKGNGCGSSAYLEETKFFIDKNFIVSGTNYWTLTEYNKVNSSLGTYEVNWSFSNLASDWWMAKIKYNILSNSDYAPICSSPSNILTYYTGCP